MRESKKKNIYVCIPKGLFERELLINCGTSMIDCLQNSGKDMIDEQVHDKLLLTW
jgi:DNA adenine methylase